MWEAPKKSVACLPLLCESGQSEEVTAYMKQMGKNDNLSLKHLSLKLVMLMALVGCRNSQPST